MQPARRAPQSLSLGSLGRTENMTIAALKEYADTSPKRWHVPLFIVTHVGATFKQSPIRKVEIDRNDCDVNFITEDGASGTITLHEIRDIIQNKDFSTYSIFSRKLLNPPIIVDGMPFTHIDTPIYGSAESGSGAVGLFEIKNEN